MNEGLPLAATIFTTSKNSDLQLSKGREGDELASKFQGFNPLL
jgi:hypothetical protein